MESLIHGIETFCDQFFFARCMCTLFALVRCYDTMLGQASPLKKNGKEGCEAVRLINIVEEIGNSFVALPGHTHLDFKMAVLVVKPSFIKGSLLTRRVWLGATSRSPARMSRVHLRAQGTSNKMHVWLLGFAMLTCASVNNLVKMPELFFSVPMENWWSNLGVGLFRTPQGQLTHF